MTDTTAPPTTTTGLPSEPPGPSVDAQLAVRARDGDREAFGELYSRHVQHVHDFIRNQVHDRALADDLTQTTFLQALEHIAELRDAQGVRPWFFRIARNNVRMHVRRTQMDSLDALVEEEDFDRESPDPTPEAALAERDLRGLVWTAAQSLDPQQFAVLDMSLRHDLSTPEIAQVIGKSPAHTAVVVHRAREALGGAVRTLTVARMQTVCPRLRELVPDGRRGPLTASQRRSVEHHMRICTECRDLADRMTAPPELLSGIALLPLPAALAQHTWLHGARAATQAAKLAARPWWRRSVQIGRGARLPLAALGAAGAVAVAGTSAGVLAITAHPAPAHRVAAPLVHPVLPTTAPSTTSAPTVAAAPTPPDESGKGAPAVWADTAAVMQNAQSYHIAFTTQSLSDDVTAFDVHFRRNGDYAGTVTLALVPSTPVTVRKVNGTLYAQGPALSAQPDLFGLTPDQAAQLGNGWLQLTGTTRQDTATLIDRAVSLWTPQQIVTTMLQPDGPVQLASTEMVNGEQLLLLRDDSGTVSVTRFGAELRRASNGIDSAVFSDLNVPVTVTVPAGALVLP